MIQTQYFLAVACLAFVLVGSAGGRSTPPADSPQAPATQSADDSPHDPQAVEWLEAVAQRGREVESLQAKLRYDRVQGLVGDEQRRFGSLVYLQGPPAKFAVHFDRLLIDETVRPQNRWYIFDGEWLVEKLADEKQFIKRQVVAPDASPDRADPLALGAGPFVLPITQQTDRVLERFVVTLAEPTEASPESAVGLALTPRPGFESDFEVVELWYDRETRLPVRVRTTDASENESIIVLTDVRANEPVDEKAIDTSAPTERGWHVQVRPWRE